MYRYDSRGQVDQGQDSKDLHCSSILSPLLSKSSHDHILLSSFFCQSFQGMSVTQVEET
jgi:hypothetical protein